MTSLIIICSTHFNFFKELIPTQQFLAKHHVQSNKIAHNVNIKKTTHNSIKIEICN